MNDFKIKEQYNGDDLIKIMEILRSADGCPWDKEQTNKSIRKNFVEEVYEAIEAIETGNDTLLKEELGDVFLQVVFHSQIAKDEGRFSIYDVFDGICKKLILRHPHIFSDVVANNSETVLKNWDEIKKKEKGQKSQVDVLNSISTFLPALMRSYKIGQKMSKIGFEFEKVEDTFKKLDEEIVELKQAIENNDKDNFENELGDVLFSVVNISRFLGVDPEISLNKSCKKFINRIKYIEMQSGIVYNKDISELDMKKMDELWEKSKLLEQKL